MPRSTEDIDRLIREALEEADAELLGELGEPSLSELLGEAARGRHRLFVVGGAVATTLLFLVGVGAAILFTRAADLREMMLWGAAATLCFGGVGLVKIWTWLEMTRQSLVREVKRVELQVVRVAQRLGERAEA